MCKVKTGRENLSEALILHNGTQLPGYFQYLHGMELDSRNPVRENGSSSTFSSRPNHVCLILTTAEHNRTLLWPHRAADYRPCNQRLFFPLCQLLHCLFTKLWHQENPETTYSKGQSQRGQLHCKKQTASWGGGQQTLVKGTRKSVGPSKPLLAFMFTTATLPYTPTHPLQSTQVSSAFEFLCCRV